MMTKIVLSLVALLMMPFTALAGEGCGFGEQQGGLVATCAEEQREVILTGVLGFDDLRQQPGYEANFDAYQPQPKLVKALSQIKTPTELVVIVGTWCPDCHRETPRLAKVLADANNPKITVKYIGVDRNKRDPENLSGAYQFTRIPTILAFQNEKELGRIVERPDVSLEHDLFRLLHGHG